MNRLPTIPEYFTKYIDSSIDLRETHVVPCPLHNEKSGKSFSYSPDKNIWRCFGSCHTGGDVIKLHQMFRHLNSYEDAEVSLRRMYDVPKIFNLEKPQTPDIDEEKVKFAAAYAKAVAAAKTVDDWLELDYIMSNAEITYKDLEVLVCHN